MYLCLPMGLGQKRSGASVSAMPTLLALAYNFALRRQQHRYFLQDRRRFGTGLVQALG